MTYIIGLVAGVIVALVMYKYVDLSRYKNKRLYIIAGVSIGFALASSSTYNLLTSEETVDSDQIVVVEEDNESKSDEGKVEEGKVGKNGEDSSETEENQNEAEASVVNAEPGASVDKASESKSGNSKP